MDWSWSWGIFAGRIGAWLLLWAFGPYVIYRSMQPPSEKPGDLLEGPAGSRTKVLTLRRLLQGIAVLSVIAAAILVRSRPPWERPAVWAMVAAAVVVHIRLLLWIWPPAKGSPAAPTVHGVNSWRAGA